MNGASHSEIAEQVCEAGAKWIQLRVKEKPYNEWLRIASETQKVCKKYNATFIVDDNVAIARALNADGVHLGKDDMRPEDARKVLGKKTIIGGTANTVADIQRLADASVQYIGVGPFRFTMTKQKLAPVLGPEGLERIVEYCKARHINIPLIAIGGITAEDVPTIIKAGLHGVAVSSAISMAEDKHTVIERFRKLLYGRQYAVAGGATEKG
ncbi:MAG: thiamine phosphate synthase [Bacteroidetes bacterium]|nr:thiamine phosphate synthase [Bacteroidota bacterium]